MGEIQEYQNFVIFKTDNGKVNIDVLFENETVWLSQEGIAKLYDKGRSTITEHLKNIFDEGELDEKVVCRDFRQTSFHGMSTSKTQKKSVKYYNLKAINNEI